MANWILNSTWQNDGSKTGRITMALSCDSKAAQLCAKTRLAYTSITRIPPGTKLENANFVARTANYHEVSPLTDVKGDEDGLVWRFRLPELSHRPAHCTDGPSCAFFIHHDGSCEEVSCAPLEKEDDIASEPAAAAVIDNSRPRSDKPMLGLLPWPNHHGIDQWANTPPDSFHLPDRDLCERINGLIERLFRIKEPLFRTDQASYDLILWEPEETQLKDDAFALQFDAKGCAIVAKAGVAQWHALITLAQLALSAKNHPDRFAFPSKGHIEDRPAYEWRGAHLDVSRQVYSKQAILDFLDILSWNRMSHFHWHLTDDEGWRLESLAYPRLTEVGAWRGHGLPLLPQHGSGPSRYGGFFSRQDVAEILSHAEALAIQVVPEIDVPGHCHAALMSIPELLDPSAMSGGASVQGYVNNALNPGLAASWTFLETIFAEVADRFPGRFVHVGGDEVAEQAWSGSRSAQSWAMAKGLIDGNGNPDSMKMQAAMLRFVQDRLTEAGKVTMAWEEAAKGGGLLPDKAIMMAWMSPQSGPNLAEQGYQVVMTPGQTCYLDMAQSEDWIEPGLSWAGTSSPAQTYGFSPAEGFKSDASALLGVQACIWSENLITRSRFNHMVFPRLSAIAENGWTQEGNKDWDSFQQRMALMPTMPE